MKTLKGDISEAYKVQVDCLKDSESDSYDKSDMKEKVNNLVRLHKAMQEKSKAASHSEQIPSTYLVWTLCEIKKVGVILAPKKGKTITTETLYLVTNVYEDDNFSRYVPGKKGYVRVSKGVNTQKLGKL